MPWAFLLLDTDESEWRGRACLVLWLAGFSAAQAWRMALSRDPGWIEHFRDELPHLVPGSLAVDVLRKRLAIASDAEHHGVRRNGDVVA